MNWTLNIQSPCVMFIGTMTALRSSTTQLWTGGSVVFFLQGILVDNNSV